MTWHWPWRRKEPTGNGTAAEAKAAAEQARIAAVRRWPEVIRARDELSRLAEQAMRRTT